MVDRTFLALLEGQIDELFLVVCPSTTSAKREEPLVGIWRLTREQFLPIAESIREADIEYCAKRYGCEPRSLEQIADDCDVVGIDNWFSRLNEAVAAWIDNTDPQPITADYILA